MKKNLENSPMRRKTGGEIRDGFPHYQTRSSAGWLLVRRIGSGVAPATIRLGKKAQSRLNLTGLLADASNWDYIRWSAAAMSAKGPALSHRTREGRGTRNSISVKAWASPLSCTVFP